MRDERGGRRSFEDEFVVTLKMHGVDMLRSGSLFKRQLFKKFRVTVEKAQQGVSRLAGVGYSPFILGKGADASAKQFSGLFLGQLQAFANALDFHRRQWFGVNLGAKWINMTQICISLLTVKYGLTA
jgi:hypothetical protein